MIIKSDADPETLKAADIVKEVEADAEAAGKKYDSQWCYLEGTVKSFGKDKNGVYGLKLDGPEGIEIIAYVPADARERFEKLPPGTQVKLFGELSVYTFGGNSISMNSARLVG